MKRQRMMLAATAVVALLFLLTVGAPHASADIFQLTSCHVTGSTCEGGISALSFGTVTLTPATANTVTVDVVLLNGNRFVETGAGAGELFLFNATSGMTVSNPSATYNGATVTTLSDGTTSFSGIKYVYIAPPGVHADGTGYFTGSIECVDSSQCQGGAANNALINDLHFTVNNTTLAGLETQNAALNFFAADIQCGATQTGCAAGLTGPVDASTPPTVPDGGMTLMLLGGALFGLETLRRKIRA